MVGKYHNLYYLLKITVILQCSVNKENVTFVRYDDANSSSRFQVLKHDKINKNSIKLKLLKIFLVLLFFFYLAKFSQQN